MGILIRNGTVVTAVGSWVGDVRCEGGSIVELGRNLDTDAGAEEIDASGQMIFPGGVDPHVHMELPVAGTVSSDDFESGTAAGVAGGTTTIIDFVHPERGQDFLDALEARRLEAAKAVADYGLHMAVTWWDESCPRAVARCVAAGLPTFKAYMAYKATVGIEDPELEAAMAAIAEVGGMLLVHAELGDEIERLRDRYFDSGCVEPRYHALSRPPDLEGGATSVAAGFAARAGAVLYVVHVTCEESLHAISSAQASGAAIYGETCPHYLLLDDGVYEKTDFESAAFVLAPPIRTRSQQAHLWQALEAGVLQVVATDHCPFHQQQKELGRNDFRLIPGGAAGIEHRLSLLYTYGVLEGRIDLQRFVELTSTAPARLFGLYPRKGEIAVGSDADLVVWDPEATGRISAATHRHRCDRSIFEGFAVRGAPSTVLVRGEVRFADGDLRVERGAGRFLEREAPAGISPPGL